MSSLLLTPEEQSALWLSVQVALACVVLLAVPGTLTGWALARARFRGKAVLEVVVHLPLVLPPVVTGYVLLLVFGRDGPIGQLLDGAFGVQLAFTWVAAVLAGALVSFPLVVRSVRLSVELIDERLEEAAATLGASPLQVWLTITFPLALPGVLTGLVLGFARSLGEFGATITFAGNIEGETRTLPLALYTYSQVPGGDGPAMRLLVISVLVSFLAMLGSELAARRLRHRLGGGR